MGLDIVELVMQVEEKFSIELPDDELQHMQTVGDLYRLVLQKLDIPYKPVSSSDFPPRRWEPEVPQTAENAWLYLKAIIVDQLQVDEDEVREDAHLQTDLGAD